jgi:amidohydrolase
LQKPALAIAFLLALYGGTLRAASVDEEVLTVLPVVQEAYTFLHEHPELGKQEFQAQAFLRSHLEEMGFSRFVESPSAPTAVIAVLDTGRPGPVVALRAEMDGRPLEKGLDEPADHVPRSVLPGKMHNCGHDVHAAMLLGVANILRRNVNALAGTIVFVFQPAEETPGGADDLVRDGILMNLGVQKIFAQHVAPGLPVGTISIAPGTLLAGSSYFSIRLTGKGSHAASPWEGDDVGLLAAQLAQELSYLPARHIDIANRPAVISITRLIADGGASNALPSQAELSGTLRAFEDPTEAPAGQPALAELMRTTVERFAAGQGIEAAWTFHAGSPPTTNNKKLFDETIGTLSKAWSTGLNTVPSRGMFSEDFAFYTRYHPALYFGLGISGGGFGTAGVHTREFTIHPDTLQAGTRLMALLGIIATTGKSSLAN